MSGIEGMRSLVVVEAVAASAHSGSEVIIGGKTGAVSAGTVSTAV